MSFAIDEESSFLSFNLMRLNNCLHNSLDEDLISLFWDRSG